MNIYGADCCFKESGISQAEVRLRLQIQTHSCEEAG